MSNYPNSHTIPGVLIDGNVFNLSVYTTGTQKSCASKKKQHPKKKLIINYSDGSEFTVKNAAGFIIEKGLVTIGIKPHKVHIDKGITKHVGSSSLTIKEHLVDSLVEIDYDNTGNKVVKETQIKGKSYFDKK